MASRYDWLPGHMATQDDGTGHISAAVVTPVGGREIRGQRVQGIEQRVT